MVARNDGSDTTRVMVLVGVTDKRVPVTRRLWATNGMDRCRTTG